MGVRLNKFLAAASVASRRGGDQLIADGKVKINGAVAVLGSVVEPSDVVTVNGKQVKASEEKVYLMLNKPAGYITTVSDDRGRPTVMQLLPDTEVRVFPVGRLDYDTQGLLLFTNDGDLAQKLMHPSKEFVKTYVATVAGVVTQKELAELESGVDIGGFVTSKAKAKVLSSDARKTKVELKIHEGKNRQVRRMFEAVGHTVAALERVALGKLSLGGLKVGAWRYLSKDEINYLCSA